MEVERYQEAGAPGQEVRQGHLLEQDPRMSIWPGMAGHAFEKRVANHDDFSPALAPSLPPMPWRS